MIPLNLSTAEPEDFEGKEFHFPDCDQANDPEAECQCDDIEAEIRADFALAIRRGE